MEGCFKWLIILIIILIILSIVLPLLIGGGLLVLLTSLLSAISSDWEAVLGFVFFVLMIIIALAN